MTKAESKKQVADQLRNKVQRAVDQWYVDSMHNSVVSQNTAVHNLIHDSKPALVEAVLAAVAQNTNQE